MIRRMLVINHITLTSRQLLINYINNYINNYILNIKKNIT